MVQEHMEFGTVREPIVEGIFYPDEEQELHTRVRDLLRRSEVPAANAGAIIVPHAGYDYCGSIVASGMKAAAARTVRRVVVIGPVHRDPEEGIYLPESGWFRTPLGLLPVDRNAVLALEAAAGPIVRNDIPHLEEHCIEVLLPFIQYLFPSAALVPILLGKPGAALTDTLAGALADSFGPFGSDGTLVVLSANLTNYLDSEDAKRESARLLDLILSCRGSEILTLQSQGELT
ncbi:AmmeMemoRadiSam system protein B, partial [Salinispira pacifica]